MLILGLVEVEMVEIGMWVGSRDEDACDEKADSCDRAAEFRKAGASGIKGCHVESPNWVSSRKLAIGLIGSFLSSKASMKKALLTSLNRIYY